MFIHGLLLLLLLCGESVGAGGGACAGLHVLGSWPPRLREGEGGWVRGVAGPPVCLPGSMGEVRILPVLETLKGQGRSKVGLEKGEDAAPRADMREVGVQGGDARPCGSNPHTRQAAASMALLLSSVGTSARAVVVGRGNGAAACVKGWKG
eukprot:CAMPEP_0202358938 /NCGR_PEP_ID=MMETSP1126-20121109/12417_1 /ASSEMBLY_ACC=CAM_ASM_000457 /TAXON_ID=3047 /ORGANISM="Dunaliella tertiolecta, Strain CCMP1320" /LENGTH=150 /DNA_ID=CAMNT_0048952223 /DNA_START=195 /DNA_END=647 /DNA_ORIENTATION=+